MNQVSQFLSDTNRALTAFDREINTDQFNATIKFNDIWNDNLTEFYDRYGLPAFHFWESGFAEGDVDDEDILIAVSNVINEDGEGTGLFAGEDEDGDFQTNIYEYLDRKFLSQIADPVEKLIEEYNQFCEEEKAKWDA